ncbi:CTL DDB_G0274487 [Olea europaea subsp. europaea]|uniref:Choline transporter-like protein n=1 Tax=Olea europaea subsp. europaea TaxID=158383 RepID=A0A8S0TC33_OLEEU|nr:CTL DDB_G0274487 [Olea europaea subsp. europaea]
MFTTLVSVLSDLLSFHRLPFTMLVLQRAANMVWDLPEIMRTVCMFMLVMLFLVPSMSLFWTSAVICNVVHVVVSGMVFLVLIHGGREVSTIPPKSPTNSLRYAVTTSFGSIYYGSLLTLYSCYTNTTVGGLALGVSGLDRFGKKDRLNAYSCMFTLVEETDDLTEDFWPLYAVAGGVGTLLGWAWLLWFSAHANQVMKFMVHLLSTYLAVISVLCFWDKQLFWGFAFGVAAAFQFLYVISVIDR